MTFEQFLGLLPEVKAESYPIQDVAKPWAEYVTEQTPRFVAPPLLGERPIVPGQTSAVILSAPGAVGKSTVGREVARRRRAPLVDLAARKVGHYAAVGLITHMFGPPQAALAFAELAGGTLLLVVDALDETRLGSGEANFDAFLEDLGTVFKGPRPAPSVVLLARTDTADWIDLFLTEELRVPVARYSVDFFEEDAAREFVVRYVRWRSANTVATDSQPFVRARDELLEGIKGAVADDGGDGRLTRSVTGYAPVLEAVSEYLLEEENRRNYHRLLQALLREAREWELLLQVSEVLLDRERQKVARQCRDRLAPLAAGWAEWDSLYSPEEQFQRLLASRFKMPQPSLPPGLPVPLRQQYEEVVQAALFDHPFHGSVDGLHPLFGVARGLVRRGQLYTLDDTELARYGIHYVDLRRRIVREPVVRLLEEFLRSRSA